MRTDKQRVMFVDDERNILSGLRRMLHSQRKNWEMIFVDSGQAALEELAKNPVDIIVSDMRMPEMDGAQLLDLVAQQYPQVIRIVLSGQANRRELLKVVSTAHQFLSKPCPTEQLVSRIQNALNLQACLEDGELKKTVNGARNLISAVQAEEHLNAASTAGMGDLLQIAEQDVAICAKVLQLCSSYFFGSPVLSPTIRCAAQGMGTDLLVELNEDAHAFSSWQDDGQYDEVIQSINDHSCQVAKLAAKLATDEKPDDPECAELAFTAGLLHEVGKNVLLQKSPEKYFEMLQAEYSEEELREQERETFGASHDQLGSLLVQLWGINQELAQAIGYHQTPEQTDVAEFGPLAAVYVANRVAETELESKSAEERQDKLHTQLSQSEFLQRFASGAQVESWSGLSLAVD